MLFVTLSASVFCTTCTMCNLFSDITSHVRPKEVSPMRIIHFALSQMSDDRRLESQEQDSVAQCGV